MHVIYTSGASTRPTLFMTSVCTLGDDRRMSMSTWTKKWNVSGEKSCTALSVINKSALGSLSSNSNIGLFFWCLLGAWNCVHNLQIS